MNKIGKYTLYLLVVAAFLWALNIYLKPISHAKVLLNSSGEVENKLEDNFPYKDLNKNGKIGATSWDSFSYCLMMAHNVYNHIRAVQIANDMNDIERLKHQPDPKTWMKVKNADNTDEPSEFVPRNILYFNTLVEQV